VTAIDHVRDVDVALPQRQYFSPERVGTPYMLDLPFGECFPATREVQLAVGSSQSAGKALADNCLLMPADSFRRKGPASLHSHLAVCIAEAFVVFFAALRSRRSRRCMR